MQHAVSHRELLITVNKALFVLFQLSRTARRWNRLHIKHSQTFPWTLLEHSRPGLQEGRLPQLIIFLRSATETFNNAIKESWEIVGDVISSLLYHFLCFLPSVTVLPFRTPFLFSFIKLIAWSAFFFCSCVKSLALTAFKNSFVI